MVVNTSYLALLGTTFFWALSHPLGRIIVQKVHPLQLAALNLTIGFGCLCVVLIITRRFAGLFRMKPKDALGSLALGAFGFFFYQICSFYALAHITASMNAVLISFNVVMIVLLSAVFLKERIKKAGILGAFLTLGGVAIVTFNRGFVSTAKLDLLGCLFSLLAAAAFAFYTVAGKKLLSRNDPLQVVILALFSGAVSLNVLSGLTLGFHPLENVGPSTWGLILLLGLTMIGLAYPLYFSSLKKLPASSVSVFINLTPVFAVILSVLILGERFAWPFWIGFVLVVGGITMSNLSRRL